MSIKITWCLSFLCRTPVLRKTPAGAGWLDTVAAAGMAAHGIASIFTILGGAAFVIVAIRAL